MKYKNKLFRKGRLMLAAIGFLSVFSGANAQNVFVSPQTGKLIAALTSSQEVGFENGWNSFGKCQFLPNSIPYT